MSLWFLALRLQSNNVFCWNGTASSMVHGASMRQMSMFLKFSPKYDPHSNSIVVWRYGMMRIVGYCAAVLIILIHSAIAWFFAYVCVYMMKRTYLLIYIYTEAYPMHPSLSLVICWGGFQQETCPTEMMIEIWHLIVLFRSRKVFC